ncbi:MAG: recombinase family protein [Acidobacteriota bacterium]
MSEHAGSDTSTDQRLRKKVGIWIRVSTEDQAKGESPEHHEARARMYAEVKDWEVVTVYHLEGVSGKAVSEHPETRRMLSDVAERRIDGLIFSKLARLARNTKELLEFSEHFHKYDADLISLQESIDTSTPAGRLFYTMIAGMAQWEREEIAARVAASVPIRAKLGKPTGGAAPFGYQWVDGKLIINPDEAPIRRQMYELFLKEQRVRTVARLLNDAGHRTRRGRPFSYATVKRLLQCPTAKGVRKANYTKSLGDGKAWVLKPKEEWIFTPVEPIVSEQLWDECNAILDERKRTGKRPAKKVVHLFAGKVYCECGRKMYVPTKMRKYKCADCLRKVEKDVLERIYRNELRGFFLAPHSVESHLSSVNAQLEEKEELLTACSEEHAKVRREMEKLYRLYLDEHISSAQFGKRHRPLEERLAQLEEEIPRLRGQIDFMRMQNVSAEDIITEAGRLYDSWYELSFEEKATIIDHTVIRIEVRESSIHMKLAYSIQPRASPCSSQASLGASQKGTEPLPLWASG